MHICVQKIIDYILIIQYNMDGQWNIILSFFFTFSPLISLKYLVKRAVSIIP